MSYLHRAPSRNPEIIESLKGARIVDMVTMALEDRDRRWPIVLNLGTSEGRLAAFEGQAGEVVLIIEAEPETGFYFTADDESASITPGVGDLPEATPESEDLRDVPVSAKGLPRWSAFLGKRIVAIDLIRATEGAQHVRAYEIGLRFRMEDGSSFVIGYDGDAHFWLPDQIPEDFTKQIKSITPL